MGKTIVVTSGKGGTGKTTTVGAVAACLAALGNRTLCLDCDVGLKNLDITLGLSEFPVADFSDVIHGTTALKDACTEHPEIKNLWYLGAPSELTPEEIDAGGMVKLMDEIREEFDYCLIDSPAGIGAGFRLATVSADMAIVVCTGDTSSMRDGQKVVAALMDNGYTDIRLLVNRVRPKLFKKVMATVDDIIDTVGARLIGIIGEDEGVIIAANKERPLVLYEDKLAAEQFLRVAMRITGEKVPLKRV
jgi:septum site-determining protein MinD